MSGSAIRSNFVPPRVSIGDNNSGDNKENIGVLRGPRSMPQKSGVLGELNNVSERLGKRPLPTPQPRRAFANAAGDMLNTAGHMVGGPVGGFMQLAGHATSAFTGYATQKADNAITHASQAASVDGAKDESARNLQMQRDLANQNMQNTLAAAQIKLMQDLNDALANTIKNGGTSIKEASR
jgi:hypothetical protein